jgi:hypothetical protein
MITFFRNTQNNNKNMEISTEITVKLTTKDLEEMIIDHLKLKGIDVKSVYFNVNGHNREDDWRAEYDLDYRLDEVVCKGNYDKIL